MVVGKILCKIGIHKYLYTLIEPEIDTRYLIRNWKCIYCGKLWEKRNVLEVDNYLKFKEGSKWL